MMTRNWAENGIDRPCHGIIALFYSILPLSNPIDPSPLSKPSQHLHMQNKNLILLLSMVPYICTIGTLPLPTLFAYIMFSQWMEAAKESASKLLSNGKVILTNAISCSLPHI